MAQIIGLALFTNLLLSPLTLVTSPRREGGREGEVVIKEGGDRVCVDKFIFV